MPETRKYEPSVPDPVEAAIQAALDAKLGASPKPVEARTIATLGTFTVAPLAWPAAADGVGDADGD